MHFDSVKHLRGRALQKKWLHSTKSFTLDVWLGYKYASVIVSSQRMWQWTDSVTMWGNARDLDSAFSCENLVSYESSMKKPIDAFIDQSNITDGAFYENNLRHSAKHSILDVCLAWVLNESKYSRAEDSL